jgi:hypothetical protein
MSLPANPDTATITQWLAAIASANSQDGRVSIKEFIRRFGVVPSLGVTGLSNDPLGPIGLGVRPEWATLLRAGRAFGGVFGGTSAIGNFVQAQLWNPVGSGKRGLVFFGRGSRSVGIADQEISYQLDTAQLVIAGNIASQIASAQNLINGGAAPTFQMRGGNAAAFPTGLALTRQITPTETQVDGGFLVELPEGAGFSMTGGTANVVAFMTILWAEVPSTYP